jgi:hypothetical protein
LLPIENIGTFSSDGLTSYWPSRRFRIIRGGVANRGMMDTTKRTRDLRKRRRWKADRSATSFLPAAKQSTNCLTHRGLCRTSNSIRPFSRRKRRLSLPVARIFSHTAPGCGSGRCEKWLFDNLVPRSGNWSSPQNPRDRRTDILHFVNGRCLSRGEPFSPTPKSLDSRYWLCGNHFCPIGYDYLPFRGHVPCRTAYQNRDLTHNIDPGDVENRKSNQPLRSAWS